MSVFSDGSLDITTEGLEERLERGISPESRATIEKILASVSRLSNVEKLFLYLRLPTHVPAVNTAAECTKTSGDTEPLAVTWIKTHLMRNAKTSLSRQKVYDDYRMFCESHQQEPLSVSDFKKILLSVFPQLTTRRLGSRGNPTHMFGGISYLMQPNSFTVPKVKVEDDNQEAFCDDTTTCTKDRSEDRVTRAASRLILEWAYKLLSIPFESIQDLAIHLISKSYVSQVSEEAFTVTAGTNCEVHYKDSLEEIPMEDTTQRQLHTRHQLQRKLQERREITRQKQRMEEERTHLATQESAPGAMSAKPTSLAQTPRHPLPGVSRTPGPRFSADTDRNPRRPSVPTILPKTLLPKLLVGAPVDSRAPRRVDPPQFILLSPSASQLQTGHPAGSLMFITSSLAQTVPTADPRLPIQAVVKNIGVPQAARRLAGVPAWTDLPRSTSDLAVVSTSSVAAPVLAEGCYGNQTRPLFEAGGLSRGFPGSTEKNKNAESIVCTIMNGYIRPICADVIAGGRQGNQFGFNSLAVDSFNVQKPVVSQEVRSLAMATVTRSSALSVHDMTIPHMSISTGLYAGRDQSSTSLASNSNGFLDYGNLYGIDDRYARVLNDNSASQNSNSPISSQPELQTQTEQQNPYGSTIKPLTRTTNPLLSQSSKGRGRNVPSRSSTKTVSSILDEQRCNGGGGSKALRFYNDSRNVSQILKELREKGTPIDSEQGTGVSVLDVDQNTTPIVGIVRPNIQIVQVLPPGSALNSDDRFVKSTSAVQLPAITRSSTSLGLQAAQPVDGSKVLGLPLDGDLQSPVRRQPPGLLSEVLLSSKSVVHLIQTPELALPHLVVPPTPKAEPVFESQQTCGSIFSFIDPVVSQAISKSGSGLLKHSSSLTFNPGGNKSSAEAKCGNFLHLTVSTSGSGTGDSRSFVSQGILQADSSTSVESLKFLGVPVIMSTSESQSSVPSSCINLQQLFVKPVEPFSAIAKTFFENSALSAQRIHSILLSEDKGTKLGQVNVGGSTDNNQVRSSVKRSITAQNYCGIKKLLLGEDRPEELVERQPVKLEYFTGQTGRMETGRAAVDSLLNRLHSPGDETHPMPYKDNYVQHCTLQQLSQVSALRMLQQARLRQQVESQTKQGSRPASAFGDDKTGVGSSSQGTRPSRPNTVAGGVLDGVNLESDYLDVTYEPSGEGSRGSERSTPMSGLSPRSNLSGCSFYLDQSNAFMPIHITDSLPSVTAIKPMPTLGQRHRVEMEGFGGSRPADARSLAAAFTTDARSFVPYTSSESPRVTTSTSRSSGFAPVSSIRPLKRGGHGGAPSRQRHHSAHDFQNSCNKLPQGMRLHEAYEDSSLQQCLPPAQISMPDSSAFGVCSSSGLALLPGVMMPPVFDFQDLETAGEVEEIIAASQESSVGGATLTALQRSQSEPANCLQASCTFNLEAMIDEMLNDAEVTGSSTSAGSTGNLSSHGSQVDWRDCSDKRRAPVEKLDNTRDPGDNGEEHPWSSSSRDRLISGVELQPPLAFSDGLHCGDLNSSEFGAYEHSAGGFIGEGCTPPLSQNSSPEFTSEMPLFDKPDKELEAFPQDGGQSTALDTPNSLEGLFGAICGDDNENNEQSASCNMDFNWPY